MVNLSQEETIEIFNYIKKFISETKNVCDLTLISLESDDEKEQNAAFYFSLELFKAFRNGLDNPEFRNTFESFFDSMGKLDA